MGQEGIMKHAFIAGVAITAIMAGSAFAADMPLKAPVYVPPAYSWAGLYVGALAGYGWSDSTTQLSAVPGFCNPTIGACTVVPGAAAVSTANAVPGQNNGNIKGGLVGGEVGYNWQFNRIILGVATDFSWAGFNGSSAQSAVAPLAGWPGINFHGPGWATLLLIRCCYMQPAA
jgi:outer membrane immunogenic protein